MFVFCETYFSFKTIPKTSTNISSITLQPITRDITHVPEGKDSGTRTISSRISWYVLNDTSIKSLVIVLKGKYVCFIGKKNAFLTKVYY